MTLLLFLLLIWVLAMTLGASAWVYGGNDDELEQKEWQALANEAAYDAGMAIYNPITFVGTPDEEDAAIIASADAADAARTAFLEAQKHTPPKLKIPGCPKCFSAGSWWVTSSYGDGSHVCLNCQYEEPPSGQPMDSKMPVRVPEHYDTPLGRKLAGRQETEARERARMPLPGEAGGMGMISAHDGFVDLKENGVMVRVTTDEWIRQGRPSAAQMLKKHKLYRCTTCETRNVEPACLNCGHTGDGYDKTLGAMLGRSLHGAPQQDKVG